MIFRQKQMIESPLPNQLSRRIRQIRGWSSRWSLFLRRFGNNNRLRKLGFYGFLFFLIKGLLWLIVPAALVYFGWNHD